MSKRESTTCKQTCGKNVQPNYIKKTKLQKRASVLPIFYDTVIGGMDKIKLILSHRVLLIESNLETCTKDH